MGIKLLTCKALSSMQIQKLPFFFLLACFHLFNINIQYFLFCFPPLSLSPPLLFLSAYSALRGDRRRKRFPLALHLRHIRDGDCHTRLENITWPLLALSPLSFWHRTITRPVSDFSSCPEPKHSDYIFGKNSAKSRSGLFDICGVCAECVRHLDALFQIKLPNCTYSR